MEISFHHALYSISRGMAVGHANHNKRFDAGNSDEAFDSGGFSGFMDRISVFADSGCVDRVWICAEEKAFLL